MINDKNGVFYFLDFEFFGKDSTVKLFGDLFSHPKGTLTSQEIKNLANTLGLDTINLIDETKLKKSLKEIHEKYFKRVDKDH